jgi:hypothetical protein
VAFDLGKEVASEEERTLSDLILLSPRKHQFTLASAANETAATSSTSDGELVVEVLAPKKTKTKTTKKAKAKTTPKKTTGKRRRSAPAGTSESVSKRRRTDADADEGWEVEDEHLASCHPEIMELFSAIGLKPYISTCANKVCACALCVCVCVCNVSHSCYTGNHAGVTNCDD